MSAASYTLVYEASSDKPSVQELMNLLEKGDDAVKIEAMRRILTAMLNGDPMPQLLMQIIRFVMPSRSKELKKLLHFYWEVCPKLGPDGKLKQEMILVCNAIRNDLQHPNEYIRGATLRFLCKLREPDLLEPLIPSVLACLEHRHAYVRKNAVFCVFSLAQHSDWVPDAAELIRQFIDNETDVTCKRNAFVALGALSRDAAFGYLQLHLPEIAYADELLQQAFIEFMRRDAADHGEFRQDYINILYEILDSSSHSVAYDAANALTALTSSPLALQRAAATYIDLAVKEADNNVKLIVLDRVDALRLSRPGVLNDLTMDVLGVLTSPDLDVRAKALDIALEMVTSRNVDDVVKLLKKELARTVGQNYDKNSEYRQLLIKVIHRCAIKFDEVAASVVDLLLEFLGDFNQSSAVDVIAFVKEVVEIFPALRPTIVRRLIATLKHVRNGSVYRGALWILGEYCEDEADIQDAWVHIRRSIGEVPILAKELAKDGDVDNGDVVDGNENGTKKPSAPKVLADGTYATESALSAAPATVKDTSLPMRSLILEGNWFFAAALAATLTKLVIRYSEIESHDPARLNGLRAEALLIMTSILRVGTEAPPSVVPHTINEDTAERILSCIRVLAERRPDVDHAFLHDSKDAFRAHVHTKHRKLQEAAAADLQRHGTAVDAPVQLRQLSTTDSGVAGASLEDDINKACESTAVSSVTGAGLESRLKRIVQLTGFSDPVYAEAVVQVHQFDIVLDVLIFNQTDETMRNLSAEFATLGDLKVVERPAPVNVAPKTFHSVQTTIKVSSADSGVIFGNIVYEGVAAGTSTIVILNDVHIDIMDYIKPEFCTPEQFRDMWGQFEWENKVNIWTKNSSLRGFVIYFLRNTNMQCLTPGAVPDNRDDWDAAAAEADDECQFLSVKLHARSSFGEDAVANLSIEKDADGKISGHVRIRSKGQGLALSLGDRVGILQRKSEVA